MKKQKKSRQCYIPTYPIDLSDNTDNQYNNQEKDHEIPHITDSFSPSENLYFIRQQRHIALADGDNFNDLKDNPIIEAAKPMHEILMNLELQPPCIVCKETWYDKEINKKMECAKDVQLKRETGNLMTLKYLNFQVRMKCTLTMYLSV